MKKIQLLLAIAVIPFFLNCSKTETASNEDNINIDSPLIGDWSTTGSVFASYVNAAGLYIGDASINENYVYKYNSNGTYESFYASTTGFNTHTYYYKGKFSISNNLITIVPTFYEHKLNTQLQPNNDPNNMAQRTETYAIYIDQDTQKKYLILDEENGGGWTRLYRAE